MPYARSYRRRYARRASSTKSIARRRPTAGNQKSQIMSLSKRVNTLARRQRNTSERVFNQITYDSTISTPYGHFPLLRPEQFVSVFGEPENAQEASKLNLTKLNLDLRIVPHTEPSLVTMTCFLFSPLNNKVFQETSSMTSFTNGTDYSYTQGMCLMNPKRFKIHKVWRVKTSGQLTYTNPATGSGVASHADVNDVRSYTKHRRSIQLKNSMGSWKDLTNNEIPIRAHTSLLVFNNNYSVDLENPGISIVAHWSGYTS